MAKAKAEVEAATTGAVVKFDQKTAAAVRAKAVNLRKRIDSTYWELAEVLNEVYEKMLFQYWGFSSFKDYVEAEMDFESRKGLYLVRIYSHFNKLPEGAQDFARRIGWKKAKELVGVVDEQNWQAWEKKVGDQSYSQMMDTIRGNAEKTSSKTVSEDAESREVFKRFAFSVSADQSEVVEAAINNAKMLGKTDKDSRALELICIDYVSTNTKAGDLIEYLGKVERLIGVRLIAYDEVNDQFVYGESLLDEIESHEVPID